MLINNTKAVAQYPWPADCYVQGGSRGVVFSETGDDYITAFVEAFPRDPDTFLRGEGANIEVAEAACWEKYERYNDCHHPSFERGGYTNGYGFCTECKTGFSSKVTGFEEILSEANNTGLIDRVFGSTDETEVLAALNEISDRSTKAGLERILAAKDSDESDSASS